MRASLLLVGALVVGLAPDRVGADGDEPRPALTARHVSLAELQAAPPARGAVLAAPSDLLDERGGTRWAIDAHPQGEGNERPLWLEFPGGDAEPGRAVSLDELAEVVSATGVTDEEGAGIAAEAMGLRLWGTAAQVDRMAALVPWAMEGLAPAVHLNATLTGGAEGSVLAHARLRLHAGRWTRVWLQEEQVRFACDWAIEIAQATTAVHPILTELPEGQELYARWLPGESCSVVEVWSGDLEHQEVVEIDLTPVRNVPESSGLGPVRAPRTALRRAYAAVRFPNAGPEPREITWDGPEGPRRLRLALEEAPATPRAQPRLASDPPRSIGYLRAGALAAGLLFESRAGGMDPLQETLQYVARASGGDDFDINFGRPSGALVCNASEAVLAALREHLRTQEAALADADLSLRTLLVPEEQVRGPLREGSFSGRDVTPELQRLLDGAGVVRGPAVRLPLMEAVKVGVRCGASVPGLVAFDVEVAQESGGYDPVTGAAFAGLAGEALLSRTHAGTLVVALDLSLSWADPRGGRADLTFRPPVWMTQTAGRTPVETDVPHRVTLPTLARGTADVVGEVEVRPGESPERLVGVVVRGSEVQLLLARARAR